MQQQIASHRSAQQQHWGCGSGAWKKLEGTTSPVEVRPSSLPNPSCDGMVYSPVRGHEGFVPVGVDIQWKCASWSFLAAEESLSRGLKRLLDVPSLGVAPQVGYKIWARMCQPVIECATPCLPIPRWRARIRMVSSWRMPLGEDIVTVPVMQSSEHTKSKLNESTSLLRRPLLLLFTPHLCDVMMNDHYRRTCPPL